MTGDEALISLNEDNTIMMNIMLIAPLYGNGGIASWARKYIDGFDSADFHVFPVSEVARAKKMGSRLLNRIYEGYIDIVAIRKHFLKITMEHKIDVIHMTTSGSLGCLRDYYIGRICKRKRIKSILHCRYGCIPEIIQKGGALKKVMLLSMRQFDQVWVIDKKSYLALQELPELSEKIKLLPNSIEVAPDLNILPKEYTQYLFMANVYPEKGIFELIQAFRHIGLTENMLHIVGPCNKEVFEKMLTFSGPLWGNKIIYHGPMQNNEAVEFLKKIDVLVLPTYYESEAFPISILEAMSNGKLVISTARAAIPDMLTAIDGSACGIIVKERNISDIVKAMEWITNNRKEADELCRKAYLKAYKCYRTDVVYDCYRKYYREVVGDRV